MAPTLDDVKAAGYDVRGTFLSYAADAIATKDWDGYKLVKVGEPYSSYMEIFYLGVNWKSPDLGFLTVPNAWGLFRRCIVCSKTPNLCPRCPKRRL